jgi:hypothetical protein
MMTNRRSFIKSTSTAAVGISLAAAMPIPISSCAGANEKLRCGVIGVNGMGFADLAAFLRQENTECIALCDVDQNVLNKRASEVEKSKGAKPQVYTDYRKMLENKDIDVVIIGTPDHWHCLPMVEACQAGKYVYCEKPLGNSIEEINIMERAAKKYKSIVQVGMCNEATRTGVQPLILSAPGSLARSVRSAPGLTRDGWAPFR